MSQTMLRFGLPLLLAAVASTAGAQPYVFTEIALEFGEGSALGFLDVDVRPAISANGTVVFTGYSLGNLITGSPQRLYSGNGGPVSFTDLQAAGYTDVRSVRVNGAGNIVFDGARSAMGSSLRGIYRTTVAHGAINSLYETTAIFDPLNPPPSSSGNVALSENGVVAFSTISNGDGALYRGPVAGPVSVLREGDGTFFNNRALDINNAGQIPMEMEYTDPTRGLSRGILIFSAANQSLNAITTAIEKANVGFNTPLAINADGMVAFVANSNQTLRFYNPPNDSTGTLVAEVNITPGVWLSTPTAFGQPPNLTQIASNSTYQSFGRVDLNASGVVVFEATPVGGYHGIYRGPDPVADKILAAGDTRDGRLFSIVGMGELNDAGQLSLYTSDFNSTDRQIWRVEGVEPRSAPLWERLIRFLLWLLRLFGR